MRCQQHGRPLGGELANDGVQLGPRGDIKAGRRLVEQDQGRPVGDREGKRQPPLVPDRQFPVAPAAHFGEPEALEEIVARCDAVVAQKNRIASPTVMSAGRAPVCSCTPMASARRRCRQDLDLALVGAPQTLDALERRGLARAVRAQQPDDLAGRNGGLTPSTAASDP